MSKSTPMWSAVAQVRGRGYSLMDPSGEVVVTIHGKRDLHAYAGQIAAAMNLTSTTQRQALMLNKTGYVKTKLYCDRCHSLTNKKCKAFGSTKNCEAR
jgi:hypothetical protein